MGCVRALLASEIGRRVAATAASVIIARRLFWLEALHRRPGLDQGAIDRKVLARQQSPDPWLRQHGGEELASDLTLQKPVAVLREAGMVPHRIIDPKADEPPE